MVLGIQARCPARAQATCRFTPVVLCLPEYISGRFDHDQQDTKGAVDDVLADLGQGPPPQVSTLGGTSVIKGV